MLAFQGGFPCASACQHSGVDYPTKPLMWASAVIMAIEPNHVKENHVSLQNTNMKSRWTNLDVRGYLVHAWMICIKSMDQKQRNMLQL